MLEKWRRAFALHEGYSSRCTPELLAKAHLANPSPIVMKHLYYFMAVEGVTRLMRRYMMFTWSALVPPIRRFLCKWESEENKHAVLWYSMMSRMPQTEAAALEAAEKVAKPGISKTIWTEDLVNATLLFVFFIPVHMAFGALSETITRFGYRRLKAEGGNCPVFDEAVNAVIADEGVHLHTYRTAAETLCSVPGVRRVVNWIATRFYAPVGESLMRPGEPAEIVKVFFTGQAGSFKRELTASLGNIFYPKTIDAICQKVMALAS